MSMRRFRSDRDLSLTDLSIFSASASILQLTKGVIKIKRKIIFLMLILTLAGRATIGIRHAYAQNTQDKYSSIVQKLAVKFGLKESDVQSVFDDVKKVRQNQIQTKLEDKLTQAVKDGKITKAQKQAIIAKHKELQEKRKAQPGNWKNMTPEERRNAMQTQKQELENWAKQNNIDLKYFFGGHMGPKGGMKGKGAWK